MGQHTLNKFYHRSLTFSLIAEFVHASSRTEVRKRMVLPARGAVLVLKFSDGVCRKEEVCLLRSVLRTVAFTTNVGLQLHHHSKGKVGSLVKTLPSPEGRCEAAHSLPFGKPR